MKLLKIILNFILVLLAIGGFVCSIILAVSAKAWIPLVAIGVLGWAAYPTIKRLVNEMMPQDGE